MANHSISIPSLDAGCGKALSPVIRDAWAQTLCSAGNLPLSRAQVIVDGVWSEMSKRFAQSDLAQVLVQTPQESTSDPRARLHH